MEIRIILDKLKERGPKTSLSAKVRKWMKEVKEGSECNAVAWEHLVAAYKWLRSSNCDYAQKEILLKRLAPFIAKYGDLSELIDHKYLK